MNILEMRARREEVRLKAVALIDGAQKEGRFLSDEENKTLETYETDIRQWDEQIKRSELFAPAVPSEEPRAMPEPPVPMPMNSEMEKRFSSFGEQLMAVYNASSPDARIDRRLSTRAASGASEGVPSDGGFLVQQDFVSELLLRTFETGLLASKVRKIPVSSGANGIKINALDENSRANGSRFGGIQAFWSGEAESITASKPKFRQMELSLKKLTGACYATDELLQDAAALESIIRQGFAEEFGFKMDDAIMHGKGAASGEPQGILSSSALVTVGKESGQTEKILIDNIFKMWSRLWPRSKPNAVWYINSELEPDLYTLKLGDIPAYLPPGGVSSAPYGTLMGRPVLPIEQCAAAGEVGDIVLCDLSQYLLIDKGGINAASSIHVRFLYDENVFRFIYRVDGQPIWNSPLTPYKGSAAQSPFVALAKRNGGA